MSERKQIPVDYQEREAQPITLTRRGRLAVTGAGLLLAAGAVMHGVHEQPENPVGHLVGDVINVGTAVVDVIPGVDLAEVPEHPAK